MGGRARRRKGRELNGILLLDKPQGSSSNGVLQKVKRLYSAAKAGHTGSLDPLAAGMLPICFGEATKFSQYLLDADKKYYVVAKLGETTNTGDAEGEIIQKTAVSEWTDKELETIVSAFVGEIEQIPPMFSALKHQGQPLYKLARKGIEIERKARPITIYSLEWKQLDSEHLEMLVLCSKGTYIRTLVEDIGKRLGCGAHVEVLRRLKAGPFENNMVTIEKLEEVLELDGGQEVLDSFLLPASDALIGYPQVSIDSIEAKAFSQGQGAAIVGLDEKDTALESLVKVWLEEDGENIKFLGVGVLLPGGRVSPKRLMKTE
ncbi:MAG: tRNA pseudouridine(55) synthase TruB [Pseudomonadales bacterium]|nr:tRNA pseudouridine(55) synthase TruB [Pseudomonadales bacterium]